MGKNSFIYNNLSGIKVLILLVFIISLFSACVPTKEFKARVAGSEDDTYLSITSSSHYATSFNINSYIVSGSCSENGTIVNVRAIDSLGVLQMANGNIICNGGVWSTGPGNELNISALLDGNITVIANHSDSFGQSRQVQWNVIKDTVIPTIISVSSTTGDGIYSTGQRIVIEVLFSEPIELTGNSVLLLNAGNSSRGVYSSGSGTNLFSYIYTVGSFQNIIDLEYSTTSSLAGTFKDLAGNTLVTIAGLPLVGGGNSLSDNQNIIIDTGAPYVTAVTTTATATELRNIGDEVHIQVTTSEAVTVDNSGGTPILTLNLTPSTKNAYYDAANSTATSLNFIYTVGTDDYIDRLQYVDIYSLNANGGVITDVAGNSLIVTLPNPLISGPYIANVPVNGRMAIVDNAYIENANGTYIIGQTIDILLQTTRNVNVTGTPYLELQVSDGINNTATAPYISGSGTGLLRFRYTVGDNDINAGDTLSYIANDAVTPANGPLKLNGGSILTVGGEPLSQTLPSPFSSRAIEYMKSVKVDGDRPDLIGVYTTTATSTLVGIGQTISVIAIFDQEVFVSGNPEIYINDLPTMTATYSSGSGSTEIIFNYIVQEGDAIVGLEIPYLDIDLTQTDIFNFPGGATLLDTNGNATSTSYAGSTPTSLRSRLITLNTIRPTISSVITPDVGLRRLGDIVTVSITTNATPLYTTGTPSLHLNIYNGASTSKYVECLSAYVNPQTTITCSYVVAEGDYSNGADNLDYVGINPLINIGDFSGNMLGGFPTPGALGSLSNPINGQQVITIDGKVPNVVDITSPNINGNYLTNDLITFYVDFDDPVIVNTVTGSPYLTLDTNSNVSICGTASYVGGSGSSRLQFEYRVKNGDTTSHRIGGLLDYLSTSALVLNGSFMRDSSGNGLGASNIALYTPGTGIVGAGSFAINKSMTIDAIRPTVIQVTSTISNTTYGPNSDVGAGVGILPLTLLFSESVTVIGNPVLILNIDGAVRRAIYASQSTSDTLIFNYQIVSGDRIDPAIVDGVKCVTDFTDSECDLNYETNISLEANGGDIRDTNSNSVFTIPAPGSGYLPDPSTGFSLSYLKDIRIDTYSPQVQEIRLAGVVTGATQTFTYGETVTLEMVFDEAVHIDNPPTDLNLLSGKIATFSSGDNSNILTFEYVVGAGDSASPLTFSATNPLTSTGTNTIYDTANNYIDYISFSPLGTITGDPIVIDGIVPKIIDVTVISSPSLISIDDGYNLIIEVEFDTNIQVTGSPILNLDVGGSNIQGTAIYSSSVGDTIQFVYQIREGDDDGSGTGYTTSIQTINSLLSNDGTNGTITDSSGTNSADLTLSTTILGIDIDGVRPYVSGVIASPPITDPSKIYLGQSIDIDITFHQDIVITSSVTLDINIGFAGKTIDCNIHPSDSTAIRCPYTISANDTSQGYLNYVSSNALSGEIKDINGNVANTTLGQPFLPSNMIIDGTTAAVILVTSDLANGVYNTGQVVDVKIDFSHDLIISGGTPKLTLVTNTASTPDTTTDINCVQDIGDDSILICSYTVQAGDYNIDLNYSATNSLSSGGASITTMYDGFSFNAELSLPEPSSVLSLGGNKDINIITIPPTIINVDAESAYQSGGYYTIGETISLEITFSASMQVALGGTPTIGITSNGVEKEIACSLNPSNVTQFICSYTVVAGDISSPLSVYGVGSTLFHANGATLMDLAGNSISDFTINLPQTLSTRGIYIDTLAPEVVFSGPGMYSYIESTEGVHTAEPFTISGTCNSAPVGAATVTVKITDGNTTQTATPSCIADAWSYDISTLGSMSDGMISITATQSDTANNQSITATRIYQKALALSPGENHNFAINKEKIMSWGDGTNYQMGDGNNSSFIIPKLNTDLDEATQIVSGAEHSCALISGQVYCWGSNQKSASINGQLGVNAIVPFRSTPTTAVVDSSNVVLTNIIQIASGKYFTCALNNSGSVYCWGDNTYGQLGINVSGSYRIYASAVAAATLTDVGAIYTGANHMCAVQLGDVYCWGRNNSGQIGIGLSGIDQISPVLITSLASSKFDFILALGDTHSCAMYDGGVQCWGSNIIGQLGNGSGVGTSKLSPVVDDFVQNLGASSGALQIAAGDNHTCVLLQGGVKCWGRNAEGQLGDSTNTYKNTPTDVTSFTSGNNAHGVYAGSNHTCISSGGGLRCFGKNNLYQLGNSDNTNINVADYVYYMSGMSISGGQQHTCINLKTGAYCWGSGVSGRLGNGGTSDSTSPVQVSISGFLRDIQAGNEFSCTTYNSQAKCWGSSMEDQLGNENYSSMYPTRSSSTPVFVLDGANNLDRVISLSSGNAHTCAKVEDEVECWGHGSEGQLGNATTVASNYIPQTVLRGVANLSTVGKIYELDSGGNYNCVMAGTTGQVFCWGSNGVNPATSSAVPVGGATNVDYVSVGGNHSCVIISDGVRCWGNDSDGQLGNNNATGDSTIPVIVDTDAIDTPLSGVIQVTTGLNHSCALTTQRGVMCWGDNNYGQLGQGVGNTTDSPFAVNVSGLGAASGVVLLTAGDNHTCAILQSSVRCWGNNDAGQLGTSTAGTQSEVPVTVNSISF